MANAATLDAVNLDAVTDMELLEELACRGLNTDIDDATDDELLDELKSRGALLATDVLDRAEWEMLYVHLQAQDTEEALTILRGIAQDVTGRVLS